jgi:hypothetical protein
VVFAPSLVSSFWLFRFGHLKNIDFMSHICSMLIHSRYAWCCLLQSYVGIVSLVFTIVRFGSITKTDPRPIHLWLRIGNIVICQLAGTLVPVLGFFFKQFFSSVVAPKDFSDSYCDQQNFCSDWTCRISGLIPDTGTENSWIIQLDIRLIRR